MAKDLTTNQSGFSRFQTAETPNASIVSDASYRTGASLYGELLAGVSDPNSGDAGVFTKIVDAETAYRLDGVVNQGVNIYSDTFKDVELKGQNQSAVKYVLQRLEEMSLATGSYWMEVISTAYHENWKLGNAFIVLKRGMNTLLPVSRAVYKDRPFPITGFEILSAKSLTPVEVDGQPVWERRDKKERNKKPSATGLPGPYKVAEFSSDIKDYQYVPGRDIFHFAHRKEAETRWGYGNNFAALDSVATLRRLEAATYFMTKNNMDPMIHHIVKSSLGGPGAPSLRQEIENVKNNYRSGPPGGPFVSGPNHDIKLIGAESHAMRVGDTLKHFTYRVLSGIAVSPFQMGFEPGTLGAAEAVKEITRPRKAAVKSKFETLFSFVVINQILYEGGFDPYNNPEDRVQIILTEIDENELIKNRNHWADLYQKNFTDLEEARDHTDLKGLPNKNLMHTKLVDIVKMEAEAKIAAANSATLPGQTPGPVPRLKQQVPPGRPKKSETKDNFPSEISFLPEYINKLSTLYNLNEDQQSRLLASAEGLFPDKEAILEALFIIKEV